MQIFPNPIVVLDTETTGLSNHAEIIEIGAVCVDIFGREASYFSSLVQPDYMGNGIARALEISGINRSQLKKAEPWSVVSPHFIQWINSIPVNQNVLTFIAYNAPFDKRMLENHGVYLNWGQCAKQRSYQIMKAADAAPRNRKGGLKQPNLVEACTYFGVSTPTNAHRALDDARATADLVCAIHRLEYGKS